MARYVALFRGINVGKAKRIAMAELRTLLEELGCTNVKTLLNSGNAVFTAGTAGTSALAARIRAAVEKKLGVDALVIVKTARDVAGIIRGNALRKLATDPSRLLVAVTADARSLAAIEPLSAKPWGRERLHVGQHAAYIWCANGILESTALPALLGALEDGGTTRNWATLNRIHATLEDDGR
jgi:uncharacterized protein (DUF1697 family)